MQQFTLKSIFISTAMIAIALAIFHYLATYYVTLQTSRLLNLLAAVLIGVAILVLCVRPIFYSGIVTIAILTAVPLLQIVNTYSRTAVITLATMAGMTIYLWLQPSPPPSP